MSAPLAPDGRGLIERTLLELSQEDDRRSTGSPEWDSNQVELSATTRKRIPPLVEENCARARHRRNCGLIGEVKHAWASADDLLHIWDYHREDPQVMVIPADSAIVSVTICRPKPGVFDASQVHLIIVLCTRLTVTLIGLRIASGDDLQPKPLMDVSTGLSGGLAGSGTNLGDATRISAGFCSQGGLKGRTADFGSLGGGFGQPSHLLFGAQGNNALKPFGTSLNRPTSGQACAVNDTGSLRLVSLEGYSVRTDGAIFHCISHTQEGHILLVCGAPQVYELVYSKSPGWFHNKCRLIRHATGFWSRMRDFIAVSPSASSRMRLVSCATRDYAVTVDDCNSLRLFRITDQPVSSLRSESVAVVQELAAISIAEVSNQLFTLMKQHLTSRVVTHVFPSIGMDGHVRVRAVTSAGERLLFVCSTNSPSGPVLGKSGSDDISSASAVGKDNAQLFHGWWLRHSSDARPGGDSAIQLWQGGGAFAVATAAGSAGSGRRPACLQEVREPCIYGSGVWLSATKRQGAAVTDVSFTARVEDMQGSVGGGTRNLYTAVALESPVFDVAEESAAFCGPGAPSAACPGGVASSLTGSNDGAKSASQLALHNNEEAHAIAFRKSRSFVVMLRGAVQVYQLTFKEQPLNRPPMTAAECCAHFAQMALPPAATPANLSVHTTTGGSLWSWNFDDIGVPSFAEQRRSTEIEGSMAPLRYGRWFSGFLRFLAILLRPVWQQPLVLPTKAGSAFDPKAASSGANASPALGLALGEDVARQLLARLRPAIRFARQQGIAGASNVGPRPSQNPPSFGVHSDRTGIKSGCCSNVVARTRRYTTERTAEADGLAQVQHLLGRVIDVAERAQQALGLICVLHSQRSAYRILQSPALEPQSLQTLMSKPLSKLVESAEAMGPVVQLCSAAVIESGLTTPSAETVFETRTASRCRQADGSTLAGMGAFGLKSNAASFEAAMTGLSSTVVSGGVCRDLEEQCPGIFSLVDLSQIQARLGRGGNRTFGANGDILRRYATCISPASLGDHWLELARSVQSMAVEDPRGATEICAEKLEQLQLLRAGSEPLSEEEIVLAAERAKLLLEGLLGSIGSESKTCLGNPGGASAQPRAVVEHLLKKTSSLRFKGKDAVDEFAVGAGRQEFQINFVNGVILDHLLENPQQHSILEGLLESKVADVDGYLRNRFSSNPKAGHLLWNHCLRQGRPADAADVLRRLAERDDRDCSLQNRVHFLDLAKQAANQAMPASKELVERLSAALDIAIRVQVPLHHDIQLIASDERVSSRWREIAERKVTELQKLIGLQELYQAAQEFGLYHIVLVIADLSSSAQDQEIRSGTWVSIMFPPARSPYSPSELAVAPAWQQGMFPLLMVRRCATFLSADACPTMTPTSSTVKPEDFQQRTSRLLNELGMALRESSAIWDVRCIATLLEYCSCLWFKAVASDLVSLPSIADSVAPRESVDDTCDAMEESKQINLPFGSTGTTVKRPSVRFEPCQQSPRAWIALNVLLQRPFHFTLADVLKFYAAMVDEVPSWLRDVHNVLSADQRTNRPSLNEGEVCTHLGEILVSVVGKWIAQADGIRTDGGQLAEEFAAAWATTEGLLSRLRSRLGDVEDESPPKANVQRILKELRRLETAGRRVSARCSFPIAAPERILRATEGSFAQPAVAPVPTDLN